MRDSEVPSLLAQSFLLSILGNSDIINLETAGDFIGSHS